MAETARTIWLTGVNVHHDCSVGRVTGEDYRIPLDRVWKDCGGRGRTLRRPVRSPPSGFLTTNGELLRLAAEPFDVFVTADQNLEYQQNLEGAQIAVLVLAAKTSRFDDLEALLPRLQESLSRIRPGEVVRIAT